MTPKPIRDWTAMRILALAFAACGFFGFSETRADENACSELARSAKRLLVVTAGSMGSVQSTLRLFEREASGGSWSQVGAARKAILDRGGLGWGWDQQSFAANGEPTKREGDGRTPAGVFGFERAFGFGKTGPGKDYLHLASRKTYCVDDLRSPHYNKIVDKSQAGENTTGEDMGTISLYRHGLQINFPTNAAKSGGSCIFLHVWRSPSSPTTGCVALQETDVKELQEWATKEPTVIAIVPKRALSAIAACFPGLS